jgi:hypothetical protein
MPALVHPVLGRLLGEAIDYAGLFPPARLGMGEAIRAYEDALSSPDSWALGRFVVPAGRLEEFAGLAGVRASTPWRLAATLGPSWDDDLSAIMSFPLRCPPSRAVVDSVEFGAESMDELRAGLRRIPNTYTRFAELPLHSDLRSPLRLLAGQRASAKFRTGGTVPEAFPSTDQLLVALAAAVAEGVPFKCTAGLHHLTRGTYRLTYEPGAASGWMNGYLNVMLATAALVGGMGTVNAHAVLVEEDPSAFVLDADGIRWNAVRFDGRLLDTLRTRGLTSFGSCSFREPMDELRHLGAAP